MKPEVYFSKLKKQQGRVECFSALMDRTDDYLAGFRRGSFVGIKMTVGERKSTGYIRPELVRVLVEGLRNEVQGLLFLIQT
ncbi:MAG: hypothetical protein L0922_04100 [Candidatus Mariimomonas ferrooxydans]